MVDNELDELVDIFVTPIGSKGDAAAKQEERGGDIVAATKMFLREKFPRGTDMSNMTDYFETVGGSCRSKDSDMKICEYCRNKMTFQNLFPKGSVFYAKLETLWIVEAYVDSSAGSTTAPQPVRALAFTVARYGEKFGVDEGLPEFPETCDLARANLGKPQFFPFQSSLPVRHTVYGQPE